MWCPRDKCEEQHGIIKVDTYLASVNENVKNNVIKTHPLPQNIIV